MIHVGSDVTDRDNFQFTVRMNQHLRIPFDPLVKFLVRRRRILDVDLMRNNEARLRLPCYDHVAKISVVRLDITLAGTEREPLRG